MTPAAGASQGIDSADSKLSARYKRVRAQSETLCEPLETDDYAIQSMTDVSPPKWHLAHTSWFFETFILTPHAPGYKPFHPRFNYMFNSYYKMVGVHHPRPQRGLLNRPTAAEIYQYRAYVDEHMAQLLAHNEDARITALTVLGLNHEQQHQELLLTDIKHIFACNPLRPIYRQLPVTTTSDNRPLQWLEFEGGVKNIGYSGDAFAYDNETPQHKEYVNDFRLASRPVTNGEFMEFMEAGAYSRPQYWLSDAWKIISERAWQAPLYWERIDGQWWHMTLGGMRPVDPYEPVCHVSQYEAEAYARWAGKRLPSEAEWELAAGDLPITGNLCDAGLLQPAPAPVSNRLVQMFGDVWEWTRSPYTPYPGYHAADGALGEYNGKFMSSQMVLRGGSCATPADHIRPTYRNFFYPADRWQFSGLRLAEDL